MLVIAVVKLLWHLVKSCTVLRVSVFSWSYCYTVWSAIGIIMLSLCSSVTLCIVALRICVGLEVKSCTVVLLLSRVPWSMPTRTTCSPTSAAPHPTRLRLSPADVCLRHWQMDFIKSAETERRKDRIHLAGHSSATREAQYVTTEDQGPGHHAVRQSDLGVIIDTNSHTADVVRSCFYQFANYEVSGVRWQLMLGAHSLLPLWLIEWTIATRCCMARPL